jgi:hypothetical protein
MGKNAPEFVARAMRYRSCVELVSLLCMNRTISVGRHTSVIPEALGLAPWGVVTALQGQAPRGLRETRPGNGTKARAIARLACPRSEQSGRLKGTEHKRVKSVKCQSGSDDAGDASLISGLSCVSGEGNMGGSSPGDCMHSPATGASLP